MSKVVKTENCNACQEAGQGRANKVVKELHVPDATTNTPLQSHTSHTTLRCHLIEISVCMRYLDVRKK